MAAILIIWYKLSRFPNYLIFLLEYVVMELSGVDRLMYYSSQHYEECCIIVVFCSRKSWSQAYTNGYKWIHLCSSFFAGASLKMLNSFVKLRVEIHCGIASIGKNRKSSSVQKNNPRFNRVYISRLLLFVFSHRLFTFFHI